jgi:hypothetical protein
LTTVDDGGRERSYGIWGFVALFVVLAIIGGLVLFVGGTPRSPTEQVGAVQTPNTTLVVPTTRTYSAGEEPAPSSTVAPSDPAAPSDSATPPAPSVPVTVPGGAAAPEGVREVLRADQATSFTFDVPEQLITSGADPVVVPTRVEPGGEAELRLWLSCARTSDELLAQVSIDESGSVVTVLAVALAPAGGAPCDPAAPPRELVLPLARPLDGRTVSVVPAGGGALPSLSAP